MARSNAAASAPKKKAASTAAAAAPADVAGSAAPPPAAPATPVPAGDKADRVNAYHLPSLKTAFDQSLIATLTGPDFAFAQSHTHTDVKLVLGFLACGIALGSTGWVYAAGVGWEESKPVLRLAVGAYALLMLLSTAYSWRVEKGTVFVGKKKALVDGRIETSHLTIASRTTLAPVTKVPLYHPHLTLLRSTNAGKSLLAKLSVEPALPMAEFASAEGDIDGEGLARWVAGALEGK